MSPMIISAMKTEMYISYSRERIGMPFRASFGSTVKFGKFGTLKPTGE